MYAGQSVYQMQSTLPHHQALFSDLHTWYHGMTGKSCKASRTFSPKHFHCISTEEWHIVIAFQWMTLYAIKEYQSSHHIQNIFKSSWCPHVRPMQTSLLPVQRICLKNISCLSLSWIWESAYRFPWQTCPLQYYNTQLLYKREDFQVIPFHLTWPY